MLLLLRTVSFFDVSWSQASARWLARNTNVVSRSYTRCSGGSPEVYRAFVLVSGAALVYDCVHAGLAGNGCASPALAVVRVGAAFDG